MRQGIRKGWGIDIGQDIDMRDRDRERRERREAESSLKERKSSVHKTKRE